MKRVISVQFSTIVNTNLDANEVNEVFLVSLAIQKAKPDNGKTQHERNVSLDDATRIHFTHTSDKIIDHAIF